mgnify:CR=1 FL=1|jgi:hypothetical protein
MNPVHFLFIALSVTSPAMAASTITCESRESTEQFRFVMVTSAMQTTVQLYDGNQLITTFTNVATTGDAIGNTHEYLGVSKDGYGISFSAAYSAFNPLRTQSVDFNMITPSGKIVSSATWMPCR